MPSLFNTVFYQVAAILGLAATGGKLALVRTGFFAGLTVAQISEFSLILAALGFSLGHIDRETVGLITLVGLITISASMYMIFYSHVLYQWLGPYLSIFKRKVTHRERGDATDDER